MLMSLLESVVTLGIAKQQFSIAVIPLGSTAKLKQISLTVNQDDKTEQATLVVLTIL